MLRKFGRHEASSGIYFPNSLKCALFSGIVLPSFLLAQISKPDSLRQSVADTIRATQSRADSADLFTPRKILVDTSGVPKFLLPNTAFHTDTAVTSTHLFQDFIHLVSQTLPMVSILAGEVGQPRYWATGDLPPRAVQIVVDDIHWISGVYGTVDLTGLPDAHAQILEAAGAVFPASPYTIHLTSDSLNFAVPFSRIEYAKGPFGADAVRFRFGRALGKRLAAYLNSAFSNSDGQFVERPYEGRKTDLQVDYFLTSKWKLRYRHLNSRNRVGVGVPFFPEEWPGITNAFHKEERLYHALELTSLKGFQARSFFWQVKEELNDPARRQRHRLLDVGADLLWTRQTEKWRLQFQFSLGLENIKSTSIDDRSRLYERASTTFGRRLTQRTWLQLGGHFAHKKDWPYDAALQAQLITQQNPSLAWWLSGGIWKIAPALGERDNTLPYLAKNGELRAINLQRNEIGVKWQRQSLDLQFRLNGSFWKDGLIFQADTSKNSGALFNNAHNEFVLATQFDLRWKFLPRWHLGAIATQTINGLPKDFWFWHQPEGYSRVYFETLQSFFDGDLEILPRLAGRFIGKRYSPSFATDAVKLFDHELPAAAILDFQIRLRHGDGALLFSWENVLNKQFNWRHDVPAVGRYLRWGFWWNFLN